MAALSACIQKTVDLDCAALYTQQSAKSDLVKKSASLAWHITSSFPLEFLRGEENAGDLFLFDTPSDGSLPLHALSQEHNRACGRLTRLLFRVRGAIQLPACSGGKDKECPSLAEWIPSCIPPDNKASFRRGPIAALTGKYFVPCISFCGLPGSKRDRCICWDEETMKATPQCPATMRIGFGWTAEAILCGFRDVPNPTTCKSRGTKSSYQIKLQ